MIRFFFTSLFCLVLISTAQAQETTQPSFTLSYIHNGEIKNDKSAPLRSREDAQKILKALSPVVVDDPAHTLWNSVPLKPALSAEQQKTYVALAWKAHEDTEADFINIIHGAPNPGGPYSNNRKSYLGDIRKMAYAIIGAYGTFNDIPKLLDTAYIQRENGSVYIQDAPLIAASTIQGRLGLTSHIFIEKSNDHLPDRPYVAAAFAWAGSLYGDENAARKLLKINTEHYDTLKVPGMWFLMKSARALAAAPAALSSLDFMRNVLDDYNAAVKVADAKTIQSLPATLSWSMPYALAYLQAYGDDTDMTRINETKIFRGSYKPILFALAEYPVPLAAQIVDHTIEPKYTRKNLAFNFYCAGLFNRNSKQSFQFYDEFKTLWLDSQPTSSDPQARDKYANSYELEMSRCHASGTAAQLVASGNNGDTFSNPWIKPHTMPTEISSHTKGMQGKLPYLDMGYFDYETMANQVGDNKYKDIFMAFPDLIDTQHFTPVEIANGSRRAFVRTVNKDTTTLSGIIDVAPRVKDGTLQIGIRFAVDGAIDSAQGFAQAIEGESYDIVGMQEKGGLPLIDVVSLETVTDKKIMTFVRTTDSGVHIFETPYDGAGANSWVEVFLSAAGDRWPVHVPLYRHLNK